MRLLICLLFALASQNVYSQKVLTQHEKDSIKVLVCQIEQEDQAIRKAFQKASQSGDSSLMDSLVIRMNLIDSSNFHLLAGIIQDIGFPCPQLLGEGACYPTAILIHWCKGYPAWFSSPSLIPIFKREIENGNLPLPVMDFSFFSYISYLKADPALYHGINEARVAYGLKPYTRKEYDREETADLLTRDTNEERRRNKLPVKQTPVRSAR